VTKSVVFTLFHLFEGRDEKSELECEVTLTISFNGYKISSFDVIVMDGKKLNFSQIEDVVEEVGTDALEAKAIEQLDETDHYAEEAV
jgi:hypothetical protein